MDFIKNFFHYNKHQSEQKYLSDDIFEQIKDFDHDRLTEEQELLIDKLILNKELKERYKDHGLCIECKQPNTGWKWCQSCNAKHFQQNFNIWTSGNSDIDKLIQESQLNAKNRGEKLEWIEYDGFYDIKYITKGGFGKIYKAKWKDGFILCWNYEINQWDRLIYVDKDYRKVALKSLNNSKDVTLEFLNEIKFHLKMNYSENVIDIYGITKDPKTSDFMMVMEYAKNGDLRHSFNTYNWRNKIIILRKIAHGLRDIHKEGLTHQDFHSGNVLNVNNEYGIYSITDLGLCKPANEKSEKYKKNVYGVLPYVAPEVLRGKEYTQESDIYSFGIIMYEVSNGLPPYYDMPHDEFLAVKICQGLRPRLNIKTPQLLDDLFKQCVDADPSKRPTAEYLCERFNQWWDAIDYYCKNDSEIYKQIVEADEFNENHQSCTKSSINTEFNYTTHPQAIYTSRLLNFNNLPEQKNASDHEEYSVSIEPIDFTQLKINSRD